ncbi:hypothetical protein [Micromonospora sp. RP3T]|uniref:hypothetical protein n=1 Tax=Micromonospora sp. RP3T TaxID=2135446 RepID=UPI0011B1D5B5|nr:hypothetical protein [Micromonospora sp. RP3T]
MTWLWIACGTSLPLAATSAVVLLRRRRRMADAEPGRDAVARRARRAMAEMDNRRRRSGRGTIRGAGGGGDRTTMYDAAYGSDTSAGA